MNNSKEIKSQKNDIINTKKLHIKNIRFRSHSKHINKSKPSGLKLSRIEEFIEIGNDINEKNLKNRLFDTCVLKNIKKLILTKDDENSKDNEMAGYSVDKKNKTIIKFNKSPNKLKIEEFLFPDKTAQKNRRRKLINFDNDSFEKKENNNVSEYKKNINFLKKFKDNYESDPEENKKRRKRVKSNTIIVSKKLKKDLKGNKYKNTVFIKHNDLDKILKIVPKEKKKIKNEDNEKDNNNQKEKPKIKKEESKKIKEKENNEDKNINNSKKNIEPTRRKNKSKTRKQPKITFSLDKNKNKKITRDCIISNNNIEKIEINKKSLNNDDLNKNEINKKSNNKKTKSNKNKTRRSIKSSNNENENEKEKNSAKNKKFKKKINKFQSVICTKKNSVFDSKNRKLTLNKKQSSNSLIKKNEENNNDSEYNIFFDNQDDKSISSSNSDENSKIKWKNKKQKFQTNIKLSKDESNTSKRNELSESRDSSIKIKEMKKIKDNKDFKNMNNILNASKYIIRHVNDIFVGKIKDKNEDYKSSIINIPRFQVVQPQNIIYFEYNRAYERPNSIQKFIIRKSDDTLNDNNIKIPKENNGNENNEKQVKKRNKSLFCCL